MTPPNIRPFDDLGAVAVPEAVYAPDSALLDKYQGFSSELLRLALIGVGAFGFLLQQFAMGTLGGAARAVAGISMALLAASAGFALGHRYMSSDGMFHHLRLLRAGIRLQEIPDGAVGAKALREMARADRDIRGDRYRLSGYCLGASSVLLLLGALALVVFIVVLLVAPPELRK